MRQFQINFSEEVKASESGISDSAHEKFKYRPDALLHLLAATCLNILQKILLRECVFVWVGADSADIFQAIFGLGRISNGLKSS